MSELSRLYEMAGIVPKNLGLPSIDELKRQKREHQHTIQSAVHRGEQVALAEQMIRSIDEKIAFLEAKQAPAETPVVETTEETPEVAEPVVEQEVVAEETPVVEAAVKSGEVPEVKVKVPSEVVSQIDKRISELQKSNDEFAGAETLCIEQNQTKEKAIDALNEIKRRLSGLDTTSAKALNVYYHGLMSPITNLFPPQVINYIMSNK